MKKSILAPALLLAVASSSASAATVVGFKLGGDFWKADTAGSFAENGQPQQAFAYDSSSQNSIWVAAEHPLPFIPNVKIRQNSLDESGRLTNADMSFNGHQFVGDVGVNMDLSNTDFVLYYEILDNDIVELDIGAAYKKMSGSVRVSDAGHPESKDLDDGIVMGYAAVEAGIPGIGLYGFVDVMQGVDESSVHDYALGLGWEFDGLTADYRVRAGYREFNFDVSGFSGMGLNMKSDGYFVGIEVDF